MFVSILHIFKKIRRLELKECPKKCFISNAEFKNNCDSTMLSNAEDHSSGFANILIDPSRPFVVFW
jgi:hypothetical protein